jgi:predicted RNase H-like HicB family nuclease
MSSSHNPRPAGLIGKCGQRILGSGIIMRTFSVVVERDQDTGLFVGYVPGWPGAHSQAASLDELQANLQEVVGMLLEDGEPNLESEFVAVQTIKVA